MIISPCVCGPRRSFRKKIHYKNESVFKAFEGTIIGKCTTCGLFRTFPSKKNKSYDPVRSRGEMYEKESKKFLEFFLPIVEKIKSRKNKGTVLDVGCSSGLLLELLKKEGLRISGIEPNLQAFKIARKKLGKTIFHGTLNSYLKKRKERFDVVIYNHVLEHIQDINEELEVVKKIVKKGGLLVVGVPNRNNIIFFIRGKYWEPLMPNEHVWHFTISYMKSLLKKYGFKTVDISYTDDPRLDYSLKKRVYFKTLSTINKLFQTGESVLLIAVKK